MSNPPAKLSAHVALAIDMLEASYHGFKVHPSHYAHWEYEFGDCPPDMLAQGCRDLIHHHSFGAPALALVVQAVGGVWKLERHQASDCHGVVNADAPYRSFHVKRNPFTNVVRRAFDEQGNMIEWPSQNHRVSAAKMLREYPDLLPPGMAEQIQRTEERKRLHGGSEEGSPDWRALGQ